MPYLRYVNFISIGNFNTERDSLVFPLEKSHGRIRLALIKPIRKKFCMRSGYWGRRHPQNILFWIVLKTSPACGVGGEDPLPRPFLLDIQKQAVRSSFDFFAIHLHIMRKRDSGGFICAGPPGRSLGRPKTFVNKTIVHQFAPDVSAAVRSSSAVQIGAVI